MTTLRVILDEMHGDSGIARYTEELTREIIRVAPRGCYVEGFVSASTEVEYAHILDRLPGLQVLHKSPLARRELRAAWHHGFTRLPGKGMVHATSPLAPLSRHDRLNDGDQIAVTFHNALAWTHPEFLDSRTAAWHKGVAKRAVRYADAIVVPTHAVAEDLAAAVDFGDRIRVISGAPSSALSFSDDASDRRRALAIPDNYVLAVAGSNAERDLSALVTAMVRVDAPLVVIGLDDAGIAGFAGDTALAAGRLHRFGDLGGADLAAVVRGASVFAYPNIEEGFGMPMLDALALGTPVVHSDDAAVLEIASDAGLVVPRQGEHDFADGLAEAITSVLTDSVLAERLRYSGVDRSRAYSWRSSAEKVWQLHADL